ncbi:ATP-dependent RNA helicase prh1 [Kwoniella mangroviensis CBS 10435]|uniref:RNA helicase n=1 Tax=Kwoniella mangroviensis CBS 10435 TaxID=1331196 RepID=A0A1B9ISA5_9TREE|nr:ATP-dependent RNA helicase prh1 [Kwoniella mangroviensis CBS 10435]
MVSPTLTPTTAQPSSSSSFSPSKDKSRSLSAVPVTASTSKVSNFLDNSSEEDDEDEEEDTIVRSKLRINGDKTKKRKFDNITNGHNTSSPKKLAAEGGSTSTAESRRKEAERLFEKRKQLPFYQGRKEILEEILNNDTTIILGETGCGKSTQLPQLLRSHPLSKSHYPTKRGPKIVITQPRRLPAIALANRVAAEMGCMVGEEVGYSVRFEEMVSRETGVRYCTEGVLMRELANPDPSTSSSNHNQQNLNLLLKYDIIIIDEAHERTLNTDFLCGALKKVQRIRKNLVAKQDAKGKAGVATGEIRELKLVIMSATLDPGKFQRFFQTGRDALLVKGRMYDVLTQHTTNPVDDFIEAAARQVMNIHCNPNHEGDVLVFMPGSDEIENCVELLRRAGKQLPEGHKQIQVLPLYAALPPTAQAKIFLTPPKNTRRVIVATNIAETSMTIPGVSFVVDTGYKKEKEYIFRKSGSIEQLKRKEISQAAAWQRTGRAGRERDGHCYRLFSKELFEKMPEHDAPEIQRCNLSSAVLQLIAMGQNPFEFEYIDNPGRDNIAAAFQELAGLGALSGPTEITDLGREMLKYPLDPPHARILIASFENGCPNEIIDILSIINAGGTVFVDRPNEREEASNARAKFVHRDGDHMTALKVFRDFLEIKHSSSGSGLKNDKGGVGIVGWCKDNYVNHKTLNQAIKIRDQLRELSTRYGQDWKVSTSSTNGDDSSPIVRSLLMGLFMNSAVIQADGSYKQTAGSLTVKIHPSSVLMSKKVPAILYDELTVTSSFYARNVSSFEQHWLTELPIFAKSAKRVAVPVGKGQL